MVDKIDRIYSEYLELAGILPQKFESAFADFTKATIAKALEEEPRINSGCHFMDWLMMFRDKTMTEFYGDDYFE